MTGPFHHSCMWCKPPTMQLDLEAPAGLRYDRNNRTLGRTAGGDGRQGGSAPHETPRVGDRYPPLPYNGRIRRRPKARTPPPLSPVRASCTAPTRRRFRRSGQRWKPNGQDDGDPGHRQTSLPIIWDADFLYGPRTPIGRRQLGVVRNQRELGIRDPRPGTGGHRTSGIEQIARRAKRIMAFWERVRRRVAGLRDHTPPARTISASTAVMSLPVQISGLRSNSLTTWHWSAINSEARQMISHSRPRSTFGSPR